MGTTQLYYSTLVKATERLASGLEQPMNICSTRANQWQQESHSHDQMYCKKREQHKVVMETSKAKGHCQNDLGFEFS